MPQPPTWPGREGTWTAWKAPAYGADTTGMSANSSARRRPADEEARRAALAMRPTRLGPSVPRDCQEVQLDTRGARRWSLVTPANSVSARPGTQLLLLPSQLEAERMGAGGEGKGGGEGGEGEGGGEGGEGKGGGEG